MTAITKKLRNPLTDKLASTVVVNGIAYRWNNVYNVYNSTKDYSQLQLSEQKNIDWDKTDR